MEKRFGGVLALLSVITLAMAHPALAQDSKSSAKSSTSVSRAKGEASAQTRAVSTAALASQLRAYGDRNKDPLALITAARIFSELGVENQNRDKQTRGGATAAEQTARPPARDDSVAGLLSRAKEYAGGRQDLIALADEASKTGTRGAIGGPKSTTTEVLGRRTDVFNNVAFRGGEAAIVAISGDGDTDLDLLVYGPEGLVCRAEGLTDDEVCRWWPRSAANYRIEVRNMGNVYNRYRLWTN